MNYFTGTKNLFSLLCEGKGEFIMNKMKKFASIATAVLMTACMAAPMTMSLNASAGTITVGNSFVGYSSDGATHTYEAYQIFTGSLSTSGTVLSNIAWGSNVVETVSGKTIYTALSEITVQVKEGEGESATTVTKYPFREGQAETGEILTSAQAVADALAVYSTDDNEVAQAFADVVAKFKKGSAITIDGTNGTTVADGYYLIQDKDAPTNPGGNPNSGAKTRFILKVAGSTVINPKSSAPSVMKKVKENQKNVTGTAAIGSFTENDTTNGTWNDVADYCIGDAVSFKLYGTLPSSYADYDHYYYKFTDTLGKEFNAPDSVTIKVNGSAITKPTNSDIFTKIDKTNNTIEITFEDIKEIAPNATDVITIEYTAVLNSNAVIGLDGQENKVKLTYSNNPNLEYTPKGGSGDTTPGTPDESESDTPDTPDTPSENTGETPEDKVIVFTYELDVTKYLGTKQTTAAADDAGFKLYNADKTKVATVVDNKITGWVTVTNGGTEGTEVKTDDNGQFKFIGLDDGTYVLAETKVPDGYNQMEDLTLVISATTVNNQTWAGTPGEALTALELYHNEKTGNPVSTAGDKKDIVSDEIINKQGSQLPSTGGIGTTLFYVGGGAMVAVAGVFLITKKRMGKKED